MKWIRKWIIITSKLIWHHLNMKFRNLVWIIWESNPEWCRMKVSFQQELSLVETDIWIVTEKGKLFFTVVQSEGTGFPERASSQSYIKLKIGKKSAGKPDHVKRLYSSFPPINKMIFPPDLKLKIFLFCLHTQQISVWLKWSDSRNFLF